MSRPRTERRAALIAHCRVSGNPEGSSIQSALFSGSPLPRGPTAEKHSRARRLCCAAIAAIGLGSWLAGCSDIYWDRRETVALGADDAVAANTVTQMVDPWPAASGNKNIAFDGQKMQSAVERYRTNTVYPPINATTSDVMAAPAASAAPASSPTQSAAASGISASGTVASQ